MRGRPGYAVEQLQKNHLLRIHLGAALRLILRNELPDDEEAGFMILRHRAMPDQNQS